MNASAFEDLAERYGVPGAFIDMNGDRRMISRDTMVRLLSALSAGASGRQADGHNASGAPVMPSRVEERCFVPDWLRDCPVWGIALQLYELRSARNWGIGDFADLAAACEKAAARGADFIGVSPLHALFIADPGRCSPYSPSNRAFLNPLYIAVEQAPGYVPAEGEGERIEAARGAPLVEYATVAAIKLPALQRAWRNWRAQAVAGGAAPGGDFHTFRDGGGESLFSHALFEALSCAMVAAGFDAGWKSWPAAFQDRSSRDVAGFAQDHADAIEFHLWLQWIAQNQLGKAAAAARAAGMRLGLYFDFAVGVAPDGSSTWGTAGDYIDGFTIGAPPDPFSIHGQNWGLAPPSPSSVAAHHRFSREITAAMGEGGMLRLDHVMGLWQLFLVPETAGAAQGAYLRYPIDRALAVVAQNSNRFETLVIGEDLGHVPEGFGDLMAAANILSYRLIYFERVEESRMDLTSLPRLSLCCLSTHDLFPLKSWWSCKDIPFRLALGLLNEDAAVFEEKERRARREAMLALISAGQGGDVIAHDDVRENEDGGYLRLCAGLHGAAASAPSLVFAARLADLLGETEPANVPGGDATGRNWRVRSSFSIEDWDAVPLYRATTAAIVEARPKK